MKRKAPKQTAAPGAPSPCAGSARGRLVLLLAFGAAGVDAVVILGFNVLTAAQTGNTILLATALARGDFATGLSSALSVASYVAGAALGEWVLVRCAREGPAAGKVIGLEILLLAAALLVWRIAGQGPAQGIGLTIVALAALAMGLQSAAVRGIHAHASTTYITGVLTNFTTDLVEWLLPRRRAGSVGANKPGESPWWNGAVWVIYLTGAVLNGILFLRIGELALLVPLAILATCASRLGRNPTSLQNPTTID